MMMFKNYLKIAVRNIRKQKGYAFLNIAGLAIGIRKVFGASVSSIVIRLAREFTKWIVLANLIAWPLAYFVMTKWLQDFAYRIDIGVWPFILSGGLALVVALITVSHQSIKAAIANPVDSLKHE